MDGQFLVRQIYDDEITYNLVSSAAQILSEHYRFIHSYVILIIAQRQEFIARGLIQWYISYINSNMLFWGSDYVQLPVLQFSAVYRAYNYLNLQEKYLVVVRFNICLQMQIPLVLLMHLGNIVLIPHWSYNNYYKFLYFSKTCRTPDASILTRKVLSLSYYIVIKYSTALSTLNSWFAA